MSTDQKIPVTERALLKRINRMLAKVGETVYKRRTFFTYDADGNDTCLRGAFFHISASKTDIGIDLEAFGREIGALKPWETVQVKGETRTPQPWASIGCVR